MKTRIVIYTNDKITNLKEIGRMNKYSFNTFDELEIGDIIKSPAYSTVMQVVRILEKSHKYYNSITGELSNKYTSTKQWVIRTLVIRENDDDIIYGSLI